MHFRCSPWCSLSYYAFQHTAHAFCHALNKFHYSPHYILLLFKIFAEERGREKNHFNQKKKKKNNLKKVRLLFPSLPHFPKMFREKRFETSHSWFQLFYFPWKSLNVSKHSNPKPGFVPSLVSLLFSFYPISALKGSLFYVKWLLFKVHDPHGISFRSKIMKSLSLSFSFWHNFSRNLCIFFLKVNDTSQVNKLWRGMAFWSLWN